MKYRYAALIAAIVLISTVVMVEPVNAAPISIPPIGAVTGVSWYSMNSTAQVSPGTDSAPLYVTFVPYINVESARVFVNTTYYNKGVLNYSYINGYKPNTPENYSFPLIEAGHSYTIVQMINVSSDASSGMYREMLTIENTSIISNISFNVPVMGTVNVTPYYSYFG
ncbi:MAG: hypothetical protein ACP5UV_03035, partial [Thermoplasmata archaeon]